MKTIVIKEDNLGIEIGQGSVFIQKKKFGSNNDYTMSLSFGELKSIVEAIESNK